MKYLFFLMAGIMALSGCITLEPAEEIIAEMAARRVAFQVAKKIEDPIAKETFITNGVKRCDAILQTEDVLTAKDLLKSAIEAATKNHQIDDPFLAQDIMSIMKLLGIDREGNLSTDILGNESLDLGDLKTVAAAIKVGLLAAR